MKKTIEKLNGSRILVWGLGREGKSTLRFLEEYCTPACVDTYEGNRDGVDESRYDWIFVSPGIPFEEDDRRFTSQTEVFLEEYGKNTVGITGTKGKSTTSSMLAHVLRETGRDVFLMGNIGLPCFDYLPKMQEETIAVFELSCHQCQRLLADPHTAIFLNLYQDHLDRYITREHYFDAKLGITKHQTEGDRIYIGEDVPPFETKAQKILVKKADVPEYDLKVAGSHNRINAFFVQTVAEEVFGVAPEETREALLSFSGLPHRLSYCGNFAGLDFYDDSISTIPEASIRALESVKNAQTVLIGGMDRGIDYTPIEEYIRAHGEYRYILCYASGKRILEELGDQASSLPCTYAEDLDGALAEAVRLTEKGRAVILSPAAASYGYFKDFEARGDYFQSLLPGLEKK